MAILSNINAVSIVRLVTLAALCCLGVVLYPAINQESLHSFISQNGRCAPVVFVVICALRPLLFLLPSMGLTIIAGMLFGASWGTVYVAIGGALSTMIGFYLARWCGRDLVERLLQSNKVLRNMELWSEQHGKRAVLLMRVCNMPWDLVSYWAGLTSISFGDFYVASLIVLLPFSFLYTYFGTQIFAPASAGFQISLAIIVILGSIPYIITRVKKTSND
jgi:uncharacterized membrane protein YdjX (TVP38/TMEM64 family)